MGIIECDGSAGSGAGIVMESTVGAGSCVVTLRERVRGGGEIGGVRVWTGGSCMLSRVGGGVGIIAVVGVCVISNSRIASLVRRVCVFIALMVIWHSRIYISFIIFSLFSSECVIKDMS